MQRPSSLQSALVSFFLYGLLSMPAVTPHTAAIDGMSKSSMEFGGRDDSAVISHNLTISDSPSRETKKDIILGNPVHLKLQCIVQANATVLQNSNLTWKHGEEEISRNLYPANTSGEWHSTLEVFVAGVNSTGSYVCVFSSTTEMNATFNIKAPAVQSGSKSLVAYNGDSTVLKCNSMTYNPVKWLWYKVNGNEQVLLNISSESRYNLVTPKANETKLHISDLTEGDAGVYVCKAFFMTGESDGQVHINVLSLMVPFKVFLGIIVEVVILVAVILGYELISKRKHSEDDVKSEDEQMAHLKSEENGTSEASSTRQRKV